MACSNFAWHRSRYDREQSRPGGRCIWPSPADLRPRRTTPWPARTAAWHRRTRADREQSFPDVYGHCEVHIAIVPIRKPQLDRLQQHIRPAVFVLYNTNIL